METKTDLVSKQTKWKLLSTNIYQKEEIDRKSLEEKENTKAKNQAVFGYTFFLLVQKMEMV